MNERWWWTADTEDDGFWLSEFSGEDIRALVRERNRLLAIIAYAMARTPVPAPTETARDYADRLAPLIIESGWLSQPTQEPS